MFQELKDAILSQSYRVNSYGGLPEEGALQRIQQALEEILKEKVIARDPKTQKLAIDGLTHLYSESSEQFLMAHFYQLQALDNEDASYEIGQFFLNLYLTRRADLYAAAQRHANPYVRLLLINHSLGSQKDVPLEDIAQFLKNGPEIVRRQAFDLIVAHPEARYIPFYLQFLEQDTYYEDWDEVCEAFIDIGIPDDAFSLLLDNYLIALERDETQGDYTVSQAILRTLLLYNVNITFEHLQLALQKKPMLWADLDSANEEIEDDDESPSHLDALLELIKPYQTALHFLLKAKRIQPAEVLPVLLGLLNTENLTCAQAILEIIFYYGVQEKDRYLWKNSIPLIEAAVSPFLALPNLQVIYFAIGILAKIKPWHHLDCFYDLLEHQDPEVRQYTLSHLKQRNYRDQDLQELFHRAIQDPCAAVREEAVQTMAQHNDPFLRLHFKGLLRDSSYGVRMVLIKYLSQHRPEEKIAAVVDSLFDQQSEEHFACAAASPQQAQAYESYLRCVMAFLFDLKGPRHRRDDKASYRAFCQELNGIYLSIFERLPYDFKIRMVLHMQPFLLDLVMDFIIEETRHVGEAEPHYKRFIQIVTTYFGDAHMDTLLEYLDPHEERLTMLALHALCKITAQGLHCSN